MSKIEGVEFDEQPIDYSEAKLIKMVDSAGLNKSDGSTNLDNISNSALYLRALAIEKERKSMSGWLVRSGLAESSTIAQKILLGVIIINIIIALIAISL